MSKKSKKSEDSVNEGTTPFPQNGDGGTEGAYGGLPATESGAVSVDEAAAAAEDQQPEPPLRESNEVLPTVLSVAETISHCSDHEVTNFIATCDFAMRQLAVKLADAWPEICRQAKRLQKKDQAATVSLNFPIKVDHTNILYHSTAVDLKFAQKHSNPTKIEEDLRQTVFPLVKSA